MYLATVLRKKRELPSPDDNPDLFFLISVVCPLLLCCFAIFICALNSIRNTRKKLDALRTSGHMRAEQTEYTIDLTTKMDSCIEISSSQSLQESVLL